MRSGEPLSGRVLVIEPDPGQAALYSDLLRTHCPGLRVEITLGVDGVDRTLVAPPEVVIVSCAEPSPCLDTLRQAATAWPSSTVLALIAPDTPAMADEALLAGAADVLLRAPGYLEQLPVAVRKNIRNAHARAQADVRWHAQTLELLSARAALAELKRDSCVTGHDPIAAPQVTVPTRRSVLRLVAAA